MFFKKKKKADFSISSPYVGKLIKLEDVNDPAFSSKALGDGIAVDITDGTVVSPIDGTAMLCFPTKHAYGLADENGTEYLIHVGIDTVNLDGEGFETFVKDGDKISKGQPLCRVNLDFLKEKGVSTVSMFIVTNKDVEHTFNGTDVDHDTANIFAVK